MFVAIKFHIGHSYSYSIAANVTIHSWSVVVEEGGLQGAINSKNALNLVKRHKRKIGWVGGGGLRSIWSNPIGVYTVQQSDIKSRVT